MKTNIIKLILLSVFLLCNVHTVHSQDYTMNVGNSTVRIGAVKKQPVNKPVVAHKRRFLETMHRKRVKKITVKVTHLYVEPDIKNIEKGQPVKIKDLTINTNANALAKINWVLEGVGGRNHVAFALGTEPPYQSFDDDNPSVGYFAGNGIIFKGLGENAKKTELPGIISTRIKLNHSFKLNLYIYVYKQAFNTLPNGNPIQKLVSVKLLATKSILITENSSYSCTVYFDGKDWSLKLAKESP